MEGTHFPGSDAEELTFWSTCRRQTATKDTSGVLRCTLNPETRSGAAGGWRPWQPGSFRRLRPIVRLEDETLADTPRPTAVQKLRVDLPR